MAWRCLTGNRFSLPTLSLSVLKPASQDSLIKAFSPKAAQMQSRRLSKPALPVLASSPWCPFAALLHASLCGLTCTFSSSPAPTDVEGFGVTRSHLGWLCHGLSASIRAFEPLLLVLEGLPREVQWEITAQKQPELSRRWGFPQNPQEIS